MQPNFVNRTIWTGDNLDILRGLNSDSVDLIYLDPPFNSNRNYSAPVGSQAAGAAFKDAWTLDDVDEAQHGLIAEAEPALYEAIHAAGIVHGKSMKSYLIMMGVRLIEMRRVLKKTGSIYLHCDPTASHYLKLVMDSVYGAENFRGEITWQRTTAHSDSKRWGAVTDTILYYAKSATVTWHTPRAQYDEKYVGSKYRHNDNDGRGVYQLDNMTSPNPRPNLMYEWKRHQPPARGWRYSRETMTELDADGRIWYPDSKAKRPRLKRYLSEMPGSIMNSIWTDIPPINSQAKERIGYPTQKPLKLLERIIAASSNPGDVVLDPFCGCATACIAAEKLDRQWAGIDLSEKAYQLVRQRLAREVGVGSPENPRLTGWNVTHRTDIPIRDDLAKLPNYRTHKHTLYGRQEGICNGCKVLFPFRNMTVDHVVPRARGGSDDLSNLQLLCGACNSMKGRDSQAAFLARLKREGIAPSAYA